MAQAQTNIGANTGAARTDALALMEAAGKLAEGAAARALYADWLAKNPGAPLSQVVRFNLGVLLAEAGDLPGAEASYRAAVETQPGFVQAVFNLGSVLERQNRPQEALDAWATLHALPDHSQGDARAMLLLALNNSGRLLETHKRHAEAEALLTRSLALDPEQPSVIHHWVHLRQKQCAWPVLKPLPGLSAEKLLACASALAMFDLTDDPALQLAAARRYVEEKVPKGLPALCAAGAFHGHQRLRIGYLSSDFCLHPVSLLMAELFEVHDRRRVEVHGFCWSPEDGSDLRRRVIAAFDQFTRIGAMTDQEAAQLIRAAEIDVLVDLQGLTAGARPGILARRPAPCQVSYLGLPGTSALPCVDYILCDRTIVPEAALPFFSEKPLHMPEVFQVCDTKRPTGPTPTRASCALPDDAFVFCAFNNPHKYTPEMFAAWTRILARTPGSVLWLMGDSTTIRENLLEFCARHGLGPERLVFATRALPPDYLARYRIADLFLDCFPFNGGTTANDALWMGLPVLTLKGRSFASRMAASLLASLGLPELITTDLAAYEELAVALAQDRGRLNALRARLEANRATSPLFDTRGQARRMEDLFLDLAARPAKDAAAPAQTLQPAPMAAKEDRPMTLPKLSPASASAIINFKVDTNWGVSDPAEFAQLMARMVQLVTPGYYAGDNLFTWGRNNSLFEDQAFRKSWEENQLGASDQAIAWRRFILACAGYHCAHLPGDFVECGVYQGSGVKTILDYLGGPAFPKTFWAYDTYDTNPTEHSFAAQKEGLFESVQKRFAGYGNVRLVKGLLPQSLEGDSPEKIAYLHIDLNSAEFEIAVLDVLFDRLVPGGILILDDYEWAGSYRGQKIAEDQWFDARSYRVFPLPTGQGLVLKR